MSGIEDVCRVDLVIDTNALAHSENANLPTYHSASALLEWLAASENVAWVLDDQGKAAPDISTSVLASEYYATLSPQGFGLTLLAVFLASGRVRFSPRPSQAVRSAIRKLVPRNKRDQAVLGAAVGCSDQVMVSNDYNDFTLDARTKIERQLQVVIMDTDEAAA